MSVNVNDYASIISQYLYGSTSAPANFFSSALIRDAGPTILEVSRSEYFTTGPGRFAQGAMSSLVDQFFRPGEHELNGGPLPTLTPGEYSKSDLAGIYGNGAFGISFQQYNYADSVDDYAVRTFLWNSTAIELSDNPDLKFVVEADGTRYIKNYSLDIRSDAPENFDFVSGDPIAGITADYSQDRMDLSRIGQTVNFQFSGDAPVVARYGEAEFLAERAEMLDTHMTIPDLVDLLAGVNDMFEDLWNTGVTRFLDSDQRPILYGTNGQDFFAGDEPQGNKHSPFENPFFEDFIANGLAFVGGAQTDTLSYSQLLTGIQVTFSLAGQSVVIEVARGMASDRAIDIETAMLSRGSDTVTISDQATLDALNGFTFNALYGSTAVDTLDLSGSNGPITLPASGGPKFFGFETIIGSDANDVIEQDDPSHTLLQGRGGNDTLFAGRGADTLEGGVGNDFYDFSGVVGTDKLADCLPPRRRKRLHQQSLHPERDCP